MNSSFKTYHFDSRGSTVTPTDADGNITDTFAYDTYGKLISRTGTSSIIFGYNGRDGVITEANGLIYMRARYYSPDMRRFVNADVVAGTISKAVTLNRFVYANGNPVSYVDPFGLSAERDGDGILFDMSWYTEEISEILHGILDIAGFIPGLGSIADGLNAVLYALEGDWLNAGLSALAAIPGLGDIAAGCKWATKFFKKTSKAYKALDAVGSFLNKVDDVIINASTASDILRATANNVDEAVEVAEDIYSSGRAVANRVASYSDDVIDWYSSRIDIPDFSKMTFDDITAWATSGNANVKGWKGEFLAGIDQHAKTSINVQNKVRIPDMLDKEVLKEVKNVRDLTYTRQLRDFADYAKDKEIQKILYVRPGVDIPQVISDAGWEIIRLW